MAHYVLKFRGSNPPQSDLDHIDRAPGITILDNTATGAMLLEASDDAAAALDHVLADWIVAKEVTYRLPGSGRPGLRRGS